VVACSTATGAARGRCRRGLGAVLLLAHATRMPKTRRDADRRPAAGGPVTVAEMGSGHSSSTRGPLMPARTALSTPPDRLAVLALPGPPPRKTAPALAHPPS
jgi:hypothetical protein